LDLRKSTTPLWEKEQSIETQSANTQSSYALEFTFGSDRSHLYP